MQRFAGWVLGCVVRGIGCLYFVILWLGCLCCRLIVDCALWLMLIVLVWLFSCYELYWIWLVVVLILLLVLSFVGLGLFCFVFCWYLVLVIGCGLLAIDGFDVLVGCFFASMV